MQSGNNPSPVSLWRAVCNDLNSLLCYFRPVTALHAGAGTRNEGGSGRTSEGHKTHDSQKPWLVYDCRPRAQSVRSRDVVSNRDIEETVDEEQARQLI